MAKEFQQEIVKCKSSIRAIEFAICMLIIAIILAAVSTYEFSQCTTEDCKNKIMPPKIRDQYIASSALLLIAMVIIIVATINATYYGCFRVAIMGTLLSVLLI